MTKTKLSARKASLGDSAPLAKQIKKEKEEPLSARVILDSNKVEEATKILGKIPKKPVKTPPAKVEEQVMVPDIQVKSIKLININKQVL